MTETELTQKKTDQKTEQTTDAGTGPRTGARTGAQAGTPSPTTGSPDWSGVRRGPLQPGEWVRLVDA
ncbi:MAG: hypothetical protein JWQ67_2554, partial [Marmoricola sp.]|nr:hypothetical protein [Marmoricola sp.]